MFGMAAVQSARAPFASPGAAMLALNSRGMSKNDPRLRPVKRCCDEVVQQIFQGHATVQLQGSTAKGTSLLHTSDWDFFVRLNDNITTVTHAQRMAVYSQLQAQLSGAGITYRMQAGENRIRLFEGRDAQGPLPDCDVVFQRFKSDVVRYMKLLPGRYTNAPQLKSSMLERAVMQLDTHMRCQCGLKSADMQGAAGFDRLLSASLQAVAGGSGLKGVQDSLQMAGVNGEWRSVAQRVLNHKAAHGGWPQV
ncbi:hypothetical protein OEZ86_012998 [Tetradesmus obliquus]|nr:hypothetical protein OEZ86_012998 [Tetradesmus obliquus]